MCNALNFRAAGNYLRRSFLLIVLLAVLCAPGCLSIPYNIQKQVTARGGHATLTANLGPILLVRTASVLPGSRKFKISETSSTNCSSDYSQVKIVSIGKINRLPVELCKQALSAVDSVKIRTGITHVRTEYQIKLIPEGVSYTEKDSHLLLSRIKASYAFAWFDEDARASIAYLISTISHETVHLAAGHLRKETKFRKDEATAYLVGACTQFEILGELQQSDMPRGILPNEGISSASAYASSVAGSRLTAALDSMFTDRVIARNSVEGDKMSEFCRSLGTDVGFWQKMVERLNQE